MICNSHYTIVTVLQRASKKKTPHFLEWESMGHLMTIPKPYHCGMLLALGLSRPAVRRGTASSASSSSASSGKVPVAVGRKGDEEDKRGWAPA